MGWHGSSRCLNKTLHAEVVITSNYGYMVRYNLVLGSRGSPVGRATQVAGRNQILSGPKEESMAK